MKIAIRQGTCWIEGDAALGWIASGHDEDRGWKGEGDTPTEAIQQLLINLWENGDRHPELLDMLDAEFARQEWWQEVRAMEVEP